LALAIVAIAVTFVACEKNQNTQNNLVSKKSELIIGSDQKITYEDAKEIGRIHNQFLAVGLDGEIKNDGVLKQNFETIELPEISADLKEAIFEYIENNNLADIEIEIINNLSSQNSIDIFNSIKNIIYDNNEYLLKPGALDEQALRLIYVPQRDQEMLLTLIETTKKSLHFWMPKSLGGQGRINDYFDEVPNAIDWGDIAVSDGYGAVGVLMRTWYLAGFGPLSWGAILGAVGWGAAYGSGISLLRQLM
jgi:hypothetical protein